MGTLFKRTGTKGKWYAQYTGPDGKRVSPRCTGTTCKKTAAQIMAKWEADSALRRQGVVDYGAERITKQSQRSIVDHSEEFRSSLESSGNTPKHVRETMDVINAVLDRESFARLSDVTIEALERYSKHLRDDLNRSKRTIQKHLAAWKQFTKWAHTHGRIQSDPLVALKPPRPETDRRLERRALHPDEWPPLRAAAIASDPHPCGITGPERALLYELAIQTGLRSNEVRELTTGKLHLQQRPPFVLLPSRSTKNKQPARQYVSASLAARLAAHAKARPAGSPLFDLPHETDVAEMARTDLQKARQAWLDEVKGKARDKRAKSDFLAATDHEGHRFDFHALRHTCGAWLAMQNENPKAIQTIMRHSTITLTMDTYGHLFPASESEAIARLAKNRFEG